MVKFTASGMGNTMIGLGLEAENVRRLQAGQPIHVRLSDLGFVGVLGAVHLVIFVGQNAATIRRDLADLMGPDTVVIEEPAAKDHE